MTKLEHALALAARGFKVFPITPNAKTPPLLHGWPKRASSDPEMVKAFWIAVPDANIAIHCEGMIVIDVDVKKGGGDSIELLRVVYDLPNTLTSITPTGGRHLYYKSGVSVANSVETLGRGLDVRSEGGYVVGPGSIVPAGEYTFQDAEQPIADAPEWLVERLSKPIKKDGGGEAVPPAPDAALERARDWLAGQAPAVEGQGGDARTYTVACGLRDMGVSAEQALALLEPWNALCVPPWDVEQLSMKVHNAYRYAQNAPGTHAALPTDFPLIEAPTREATRHTAGVMRLDEFANHEAKTAGYLVKGLLQRASYAELFGAPGEGKTFVGLDVAYHIAAGAQWMGHKVRQGTVLYLGYEGLGGLRKRAKALRQRYGDKDVPLYIADATYNLREQAGRKALGELMATLPAKPALIVVDTFARALMGGDENSAQDVGAFNAAVAALIKSTGACVLIVHHSGKNKAAGARGSSALLGAVDTELEIDSGAVHPRKQRDVELCEPIGFKLVPLMVGMDEDGDEITSCVVEPAKATVARTKLTEQQRFGMKALEELAKDNKPVDIGEWREKCKDFVIKRQGFHRLKQGLLDRGAIVESEGMVTRRVE